MKEGVIPMKHIRMMISGLAAAALAVATSTVRADHVDTPSFTDVFDVSQGNVVGAHSATIGGDGGPFDVHGIFGAPTTGEGGGHTIFDDGGPALSVVDFTTAPLPANGLAAVHLLAA